MGYFVGVLCPPNRAEQRYVRRSCAHKLPAMDATQYTAISVWPHVADSYFASRRIANSRAPGLGAGCNGSTLDRIKKGEKLTRVGLPPFSSLYRALCLWALRTFYLSGHTPNTQWIKKKWNESIVDTLNEVPPHPLGSVSAVVLILGAQPQPHIQRYKTHHTYIFGAAEASCTLDQQ